MTPASERTAMMSSVKLALLAQQVRQQWDGAELLAAEPIAVIGVGCRFPGGADSPAAYWDLLERGVDAIREVPADRWDADALYDPDPYARGTMNTRSGGFLDAIDTFDAAFFGISPREAARMDPQHRLLLEVASEALERAGQTRQELSGSLTGVYVAVTGFDYSQSQYRSLPDIDAHTATGNVHCIIPNRLSYLLNLRGPSVAVDTACSSSLVAVHLACQSLRSRETDMAVAGGVNIVLTPEPAVSLAKWGMMANDGRCKTFDERADGFVRSEGCGVVVLKRLSDAIADGDAVVGVIRGSAVNQDGRSTAMTAPNGLAQQAVIRQALSNAQVLPEQIGYIEAHGTGTALGDPIEVEALAAVVGGRYDGAPPVALTSVKTNIGHLEAASGVAGLIKVLLCLQHEAIPAHLHFTALNPHISFDDTRFYIPTELTAWPAGSVRRLAGVSSFGFGGTNAHVVVEEAPRLPRPPASEAVSYLLPLSAQSPDALLESAASFANHLLTAGDVDTADVCFTASVRRTHHDYRMAVVGSGREDLAERLRQFAEGERRPGIAVGRRQPETPRRLAFVFSGQGPQWWGMGRELLAGEPVFRDVVERIDALLRPVTGWSLIDELARPEAESRLADTAVAQPAIFAVQVGLAELWRSWGVVPDAVVGHSVGEVAAAHVAGALSLDDAVRVISHRARLMQAATGNGKMASVELGLADVERFIASFGSRLSVAAINGPTMTVISGEPDSIDEAVAEITAVGIVVRALPVNYAFHSAQMVPYAAELAQALAGLEPRQASAFYSAVTGDLVAGVDLDATYWERNVREPVRFAAAIEAMALAGFDVFVEVAPHPVLGGALSATLAATGREGVVTCSLRRGRPEREAMLSAAGELYACGSSVDWRLLHPDGGRVVDLPTYPWQRQRHWFEPPIPLGGAERPAATVSEHPLLGRRLRSPSIVGHVFEAHLRADRPGFLGDHHIGGVVLLPATAYLELALAAHREATGGDAGSVESVELLAALPLSTDHDQIVQIHLQLDDTGAGFEVHSLRDDDEWTMHAYGRVGRPAGAEAHDWVDIEAIQRRCPDVTSGPALYDDLAGHGVRFGQTFRGVERIWAGPGEVLGEIVAPAVVEAEAHSYRVHPALLDAVLHPLNALLPRDGSMFLPIGLGALRVHRRPGARLWSHGRRHDIVDGASEIAVMDVTIYSGDGELVAELSGLQLRRTTAEALARVIAPEHRSTPSGLLYDVAWPSMPAPSPLAPVAGPWLVVADGGGIGSALARTLDAGGATCIVVPAGADITAAAMADLLRSSGARGVVYLRGLDAPALETSHDDDLVGAQERGLGGALALTHALAEHPAGLWLVTRGAQAVDGPATAPEQATLLGLGATIAVEHPALRCIRVDLDPEGTVEECAAALVHALAVVDHEDQIAFRAGDRRVARLEPCSRVALTAAADPAPTRLATRGHGLIDNLELGPLDRRAPGPGEVELGVSATGLNFRDVLNALGLYPEEVETFGEECSGEVLRVGADVDGLRPGDRVLAMGSGAFASHVVTDADLVHRIPDEMSSEEAATIPIAFLTAHYALMRLAGLVAGERVLIHAAAGGVGMAAVQLAQRAGAEIFATAGSPEKRALLASLGVRHVFDSRSVDFADGVMAATGGRGVDVVLNSLTDDFIPRSLETLAPGGRFLEIGKRGIWDPEQVASVRPDVTYFVVFLGDLSLGDPPAIQEMLGELMPRFATGELTPLPRTLFPIDEVAGAFRYMAQALHVGKVVVTQPDTDSSPALVRSGTYLITGGLGGLGLLLGRWLVERGATGVALVGRSAPDGDALEAVDEMRRLGADVRCFRADVGRDDELATVMTDVRKTMPELRGVVHAAGVNDDGVLAHLEWANFEHTLAPKMSGTWNLHQLTLDLPLDFFVLFSSASAILGAAGQANYAAANAFLDAFATRRRADGLPALSINWGPWDRVGMTARLSEQDQARLGRVGLGAMSAQQGLLAFEQALGLDASHVAAVALDPDLLDPRPLLTTVRRGAVSATASVPVVADDVLQRWSALPSRMRRAAVLGFVRDQATRVLGLPSAHLVDPRQPFTEIGLDSLMAVELRNAVGAAIGRTLPATLLFDYPTTDTLADYLMTTVPAATDADASTSLENADASAAVTSSAAADVAALSEEEAEAQLLAELGEPETTR